MKRKPRRNISDIVKLLSLNPNDQDRYERSLQGLSLMRNQGLSRHAAAHVVGLNPRTMQRSVGKAIGKSEGRYYAKPSDRFVRLMVLPTRDGLIEVAVRGSRQASLVGKYDAAVRTFIYTGDASGLRVFRGKTLQTEDGEITFLTDLNELERQANRGQLSFESIYASVR